jgi:hypothetical protein
MCAQPRQERIDPTKLRRPIALLATLPSSLAPVRGDARSPPEVPRR